jgi:hypothetical protein
MSNKIDINSVENCFLPPLEELSLKPLQGRMEDWRNDIHGAVMSKIEQSLASAPWLLLPDPIKIL